MSDLDKLQKFRKTPYRNGYLQTQVRGGIAYQVQALRAKFDLNQTQFAEKTGKKQSFISKIESTEYGRVSVQTLLDIACSNNVALVVRFVSYPEFLEQMRDMSPEALQPDTIYETLAHAPIYVDLPHQRDRAKEQGELGRGGYSLGGQNNAPPPPSRDLRAMAGLS